SCDPSPERKRSSASSRAGSAEPSSPEPGLAWKRRPAHGTPAESPVLAAADGTAAVPWSPGPSVARDIQRLCERELPGVQGLADDGPLDAQRDQLAQSGDVIEIRDAAGGDHRLRRPRGDLAQQVEVRTAQRAVLGDVGDDVAAATGLFEALQHLPDVTAVLRPAARRQRGAAHVEADRDGLAVAADDIRSPLGVLQRCGAEVDAVGTGL